jgi:hypothetical protein
MRSPSRLTVGILITVATLIVCSLGVRAELKIGQNSGAAHGPRTELAQDPIRANAVTRDLNNPPR